MLVFRSVKTFNLKPFNKDSNRIIQFKSIRSITHYNNRFKKSNKSKSTTETVKKDKNNNIVKDPKHNGKILGILGILAIGTTFLSISYQKNQPIPFLEGPCLYKMPLFNENEVTVIFVLGGPGVGKGTQCAKLVDRYGFVHLSAGDLLRAEQNRDGSEFGPLIKQCITEGLIVPQEVTVALLKNAIQANLDNGKSNFLVDGFPRKMDQAITFEESLVPSKFTLFFTCSEAVMLERLLERGKTSGRIDDNIESIKKRFKTFEETSMPVVEYFEKQGKVSKVNCETTVDEVFSAVEAVLKSRNITK
ncbi:hypothetical protein TPHA_0N01890 [Tetrapisispora phaffii CBS 4417]|uniref:Uridylate kinase n=1 Tax=Tetrapisispora phaffii (strain ATCC 24235 / CBS 4417 / NBRC 1672 / NRRL Y-8282 / UCD 70-5) TaxID=1071381 RepID=G8C1E2_TETPH|nr:LOW QUALITY PROTEIN: hypothetical protein TPHA_0N01890 [Tetrapisispora phaffii CBS 4417]CCE65970.1 hypothetical protein TPHA_0N01890 [Tetrapisispora phaffii CBS 4417]